MSVFEASPSALEDARRKAALFQGATPQDRVRVLAQAGRIAWDAQPYVLAHLEAAIAEAVAAEREACVKCQEANAISRSTDA